VEDVGPAQGQCPEDYAGPTLPRDEVQGLKTGEGCHFKQLIMTILLYIITYNIKWYRPGCSLAQHDTI
jgi:hypothetical protein